MEKSDFIFRQITHAAVWKLNEKKKTKELYPVERKEVGNRTLIVLIII